MILHSIKQFYLKVIFVWFELYIFYLGIVLSWNINVTPSEHAQVDTYQIYAYQETAAPPYSGLWKKVRANLHVSI